KAGQPERRSTNAFNDCEVVIDGICFTAEFCIKPITIDINYHRTAPIKSACAAPNGIGEHCRMIQPRGLCPSGGAGDDIDSALIGRGTNPTFQVRAGVLYAAAAAIEQHSGQEGG